LIQSAHDCAEGGLAVTVAESCFDTGLGASVDVADVSASVGYADIATLFGESASRVVVSVRPNQVAICWRARKRLGFRRADRNGRRRSHSLERCGRLRH
jgi:phosphoribosylformylglycinamidine (FGAM) synthase-like enzyme